MRMSRKGKILMEVATPVMVVAVVEAEIVVALVVAGMEAVDEREIRGWEGRVPVIMGKGEREVEMKGDG
ncbi:hypothetical protein L6452_38633 [Arctium lappa]|uniref:Uncharacterized protein n=1 Tax=Arctium lappa TaxID=4217 RepID=A0ACB8XU69_ARCLA|nr:hypothetical protein L6452_38633 [Arctium lappa]